MSTFDSTKTQLKLVLNELEEGKIQLPDFQRGWIWDDEHIRSLLVSIARIFPIGAIMLLEVGGEAQFKIRPIEGIKLSGSDTSEKAERLILDGQQRLTSLLQVLSLKEAVDTVDGKKKKIKRFYYIDIVKALEGPEYYDEAIFGVEEDKKVKENFGRDIVLDISSEEKEYAHLCFPCNQILNSDAWEEGFYAHQPEHFSTFMEFRKQVLNNFRAYELPIIELKKGNSKEAVCLVFEKVNTGGEPLTIFELITATYAVDNVNLRDEWLGNPEEKIIGFREKLHDTKLLQSVSSTDYLQGLTLLHTYHKRQQDLKEGKVGKKVTGVSAKRETILNLPLHAYQLYKNDLMTGFLRTAKFLREESFFSSKDLPYSSQLIPLAALMCIIKDRWQEPIIKDKIAKWYWNGVLGELYGGSTETRISLDLQELTEWILYDGEEPSTVRNASFNVDRFDSLRSRNSAAYKGISVLIQRDGAQDFFWKTKIRDLSDEDWEDNKLDIHHIFPIHWCKQNDIPPKSYNSILNKTAISYKANRMIGGKAPSEYLRQLQKHSNVQLSDSGMDSILYSHCIDPVSLRSDDYEVFRERRAEKIIDRIEVAMGKEVVRMKEYHEEYVNNDRE